MEPLIHVEIAGEIELDELRALLKAELSDEEPGIELKLQRAKDGRRFDAGLLIAIVGGIVKLISLVYGVVKVTRKVEPNAKITLIASDGSKLELPADTSRERLEELLNLQRQFVDLHQISIG
jgi:hypothetical protein